jgi:hypothetical protein
VNHGFRFSFTGTNLLVTILLADGICLLVAVQYGFKCEYVLAHSSCRASSCTLTSVSSLHLFTFFTFNNHISLIAMALKCKSDVDES